MLVIFMVKKFPFLHNKDTLNTRPQSYPLQLKFFDQQTFSSLHALRNSVLLASYIFLLLFIVKSFFVLERCNFTRNKGVGSINDFGSAYAVWLVGNQRERESLPHYHIIDW